MTVVPTFTLRSGQSPAGSYEIELIDTSTITDRGEKIYRIGATIGGTVTINTGTAITGEALEAGGAGLLGWLSSLRKRLPVALGGNGGLKVEPATGNFWQATQPISAANLDIALSALRDAIVGTVGAKTLADIVTALLTTGITQGTAGTVPWLAKLQQGGVDLSDTNPLPVKQTRAACATGDVHAPAANTAAVVTYGATGGLKHVITGIAWSYVGGDPTGGNLQITDNGAVVFTMDVSDAGAGIITFPRPKASAVVNTAMVITLAAGGAGVTGKLSVLGHWTEA